MKVCVLGGGVTGIATSLFLKERGIDVVCLEKGSRPGGLCQSETEQGFVMDRAGGHVLFSRDRQVLEFMLGALGEGGATTCKRNTFIFHRGRLVQYPFENGLADLDRQETFECLRDYLVAHQERAAGTPPPDNFHDWCLWRFGDSICRVFMHPYNEKLWNVDLHRLGTAWVQGRVPDAPMEDVLRSALGIRTEGYVHQAIFHYPSHGGFETIVKRLAARLDRGVLRCDAPVKNISRTRDGWSVDGVAFDRVVSTLPLPVLGRIWKDLSPSESASFEGLESMSVLTVFLALDVPTQPAHSWLYFPHEEDGPQNRVTYLSNYSPNNAPQGKSSLMAEVTYFEDEGIDEKKATAQVIEGLAHTGLLDPDRILFSRTFKNRFAYILYAQGLERRLGHVRARCQEAGLDIVGRFGNYSYFNSDACIRAAMDLAASYLPGAARK